MSIADRLRAWATPRHFAQLGILALLLATIRIPGEFLRLPGALPADRMMIGSMIAATVCLLSTILHFIHRDRTSIAVTVLGIATLIVYKFWQLPELA
ncbi:MAG: hypothetical protein ABIQ30_02480 [Devosia sp.]